MRLDYVIIGKQIKRLRKRKKLTQASLAELVNKSTSYISYIETGNKHLSLETLVDIANVLDATTDEILTLNMTARQGVKNEFDFVFDGCSTYEKSVIIDTAQALKQALKDKHKQRPYYDMKKECERG